MASLIPNIMWSAVAKTNSGTFGILCGGKDHTVRTVHDSQYMFHSYILEQYVLSLLPVLRPMGPTCKVPANAHPLFFKQIPYAYHLSLMNGSQENLHPSHTHASL